MAWWPPVRLSLVDLSHSYAETVPRHVALACFAALSADPATIPELFDATARYQLGQSYPWQSPAPLSASPPPWAEQVCCRQDERTSSPPTSCHDNLAIHLPTRVIASDTSFPACGTVPLLVDGQPDSRMLLYGLREDWTIVPPAQFAQTVEQQRLLHSNNSPPQQLSRHREILYTQLPRWLARQTARAPASDAATLHRRWLTTPRDDLGHQTPRQALFRFFSHIDRDLDYQQHNWLVTGTQPPGIAETSQAFRAAPFGRFEIYLYHLMTRNLITYYLTNFSHTRPRSTIAQGERNPYDELSMELAGFQDLWLGTPLRDLNDWVPREVIQTERARIPPTADAERIARCPCSICQTLAQHAPLFWQLEFSPLEDEFLFSFCQTEEEWQSEPDRREGTAERKGPPTQRRMWPHE